MTSDVRFTEEAFSFRHDGTAYSVHTEVGDGQARVVVETKEPEPIDEEPSE